MSRSLVKMLLLKGRGNFTLTEIFYPCEMSMLTHIVVKYVNKLTAVLCS